MFLLKKILSFMTFYDKILVSSIIIISMFFIVLPLRTIMGNDNTDGNKYFVIQHEEGIKEIPVDDSYGPEPKIISVKGPTGETIIEMHNGKIRVQKEPEEHRYRIAERQGWIDASSMLSTIINMPNKISIQIESHQKDEFEVDTVVY